MTIYQIAFSHLWKLKPSFSQASIPNVHLPLFTGYNENNRQQQWTNDDALQFVACHLFILCACPLSSLSPAPARVPAPALAPTRSPTASAFYYCLICCACCRCWRLWLQLRPRSALLSQTPRQPPPRLRVSSARPTNTQAPLAPTGFDSSALRGA